MNKVVSFFIPFFIFLSFIFIFCFKIISPGYVGGAAMPFIEVK